MEAVADHAFQVNRKGKPVGSEDIRKTVATVPPALAGLWLTSETSGATAWSRCHHRAFPQSKSHLPGHPR
jgi:hypothetical protein